jgi:hypothetical protein
MQGVGDNPDLVGINFDRMEIRYAYNNKLIDERRPARKDKQRRGSYLVFRMLAAVTGRWFALNLRQGWCRRINVEERTDDRRLRTQQKI